MRSLLARTAFLTLSSLVVVVVSEAVYWPTALRSVLEGALFYTLPTFALLEGIVALQTALGWFLYLAALLRCLTLPLPPRSAPADPPAEAQP